MRSAVLTQRSALQSYIELSKVYEAKHNEDVAAVAAHVATTLQQHNLPQVRPHLPASSGRPM
jgi:hypothetical protein